MAVRSVAAPPRSASWRWWLALIAAIGITVGGGVLYGNYSQRWGPPPDLLAAAAQLKTFPSQIGNWRLTEERPMEPVALNMLECAGYVNRRYVNQETGLPISIVIIVGPPGPTAVHTPEICFSSRAYEIQSERKKVDLLAPPVGKDAFWCVEFRSRNALADGLRVYYAWSRGDSWQASASPRYEYAATPLLFKLELATPVASRLADSDADPGKQFLEDLIRSGWKLAPNGVEQPD